MRPGPAEDRLQIRLESRPLRIGQAAIEQAAVVIRGGRHVQRTFLASFNLEARDSCRAQRWHMIGESQVLHREWKAMPGIALDGGAVAESQWSAGDVVIVAAGV